MKKVKIAMLVSNLSINGISNVVINICKELNKDKFEVHLISAHPISEQYSKQIESNGFKLWILPSRKKEILNYSLCLFNIMRKQKFNIVHVHGNSATILLELFLAFINGVHIRVAHSHNVLCTHMKLHKILYPIFSVLYTDGFACSKPAGKWLFHNKKFLVIPNGFQTEKFKFNELYRNEIRKKIGIKNSDLVIGHVGRFNSQKNHQFILKVFNCLFEKKNNSWLILVGDGPNFENIKKLVKKNNFSNNIILFGESNEINKLYSAMDLFLFPSIYEGLGLVAVEAEINGLPVVASNFVPTDVNIDERTQFLSLDADLNTWVNAIINQKAIDRLNFYYNNKRSIEKFDITSSIKIIEDYYEKIIERIN